MSSKLLIRLANIVWVVHYPTFLATAAAIILTLAIDSLQTAAGPVMIFAMLLALFTALSQIVFSGDCAATIFEYCLRGLGEQVISHDRFNSMSTRRARMTEPSKLYRKLLWQSGLFLIITAAICIGGAVAAVMWVKPL